MIFLDNLDKKEWLKVTLQLTFAGVLVTANLTASKLAVYDFPILGEMTGSVAAVAIGINFFLTDLLSEIYGEREARKAVNGTILALIVAYAVVFFSIWMPAAGSYANNAEFATVFSSSYPIIVASILSIIVSQNIDISIFHAIRSMTGQRFKFARNIGSTATSQLLDTAFFTFLAFMALPPLFGGSALPLSVVVSIITAEYIVKLVVAVVDTPLFYAVTAVTGSYIDEGEGNEPQTEKTVG